MDSIYRAGLPFFIVFWVSELKDALPCGMQGANNQTINLLTSAALELQPLSEIKLAVPQHVLSH